MRGPVVAAAAALLGLSAVPGCSETPPCEDLGVRLCAALGPEQCEELKPQFPSDPALCERTLADRAKLTAQLEAANAMAAARRLKPAPAAEAAPAPAPAPAE